METYWKLHLRAFDVRIRDERTGETSEDRIVLTKDQLRAAGLIGLSSKEIITRICERWGFKVLEIGKAQRCTIGFNLNALWDGVYGEEQGAPLDTIDHKATGKAEKRTIPPGPVGCV